MSLRAALLAIALPVLPALAVGCGAESSNGQNAGERPTGERPARLARGEAPNLLFIVSDDQGMGDVGCYGNPDVITPNLDRLAAQGVRCTDFYVASPMCSPSRASLLTGRSPERHGLVQALVTGNPMEGLDPAETLLPERLAARGYATGLVGKWHLGVQGAYLPTRRGFDEFFGMLAASSGYFEHTYRGTPDLWRDETPVRRDGEYSTDMFTDEAVDFLERHREQSWFLMLSYNAPHLADDRRSVPAPAAFRALYPRKVSPRYEYLAAVTALDAGVGRVLDALERLDLARDTWVVFLSDNGPLPPYGSAGPFRRGKDTVDEGGIRVPCITRFPGRLPEGALCKEPLIAMDLTATALALADALPPTDALDGRDALGTLAGEQPSPHAALFWDHPSRIVLPDGSREHDRVVRRGRYRLTRHGDGRASLHDLFEDAGQRTDLAQELPDVVAELSALWDDHLAGVGAAR